MSPILVIFLLYRDTRSGSCPRHHPGICLQSLELTACWPLTRPQPLDINQHYEGKQQADKSWPQLGQNAGAELFLVR